MKLNEAIEILKKDSSKAIRRLIWGSSDTLVIITQGRGVIKTNGYNFNEYELTADDWVIVKYPQCMVETLLEDQIEQIHSPYSNNTCEVCDVIEIKTSLHKFLGLCEKHIETGNSNITMPIVEKFVIESFGNTFLQKTG